MTLNERKALRNKIQNGEQMTFQDAMNVFFLPEDQDAFARSQGWEDMRQMAYYEDMARQEEARMNEQLPPPPSEIVLHELAKVDSREVYTDSEDCPPDSFRDLAGVY